jgi:hypothetical protein
MYRETEVIARHTRVLLSQSGEIVTRIFEMAKIAITAQQK